MEIEFKRDTAFRKQFFVPDSFAHPAKMDAQLLIWIVERYTKPREVILDPMAGMGTTMLACGLGRNVVLVELEEKFCKMCRDNWELVKMNPQLGYTMGNCQIIQGDARNLEGLLADKIITSPPYAESVSINQGGERESHQEKRAARLEKAGFDPKDYQGGRGRNLQQDWTYGNSEGNIGNLPYGQIDKIITSPPYEGALTSSSQHGNTGIAADNPKLADTGRYKAENENNIGNLKSDSYLEAMLQVYYQCHKVLKPEGLMILVTKNFIRNKQVIRLDLDTIKLCEQAGFKLAERHYRKLSSQSFWRIIYYQKHPEVELIDKEDILVFQKLNEIKVA